MDGSGSAFGAEKSWKIKRDQFAKYPIFDVDPGNLEPTLRALPGVPKNPDPICAETPSKKQGVFLSGANPRILLGFAGHLISAFRQKGIRVFTGKDLHRERGFPYPKIIGGIEAFRVSVVIFSDTFARRPPFFDELVNILGCYREKQLEVLPVFYNVNRSDVVHQRGTTGEAFGRLEHTLGANHVKTWRSALSSIASVPGFLSSEQYPVDSVLVDEIVKDVLRKLSVSDDSNNLLGLQFHLTQVLSLLRIESPDVRIIGIWGAGGIGKTAITEAAFKKISGEYDSCYFLRDFDKALQTKGLCHLQDEFFAKLLGEEKILISTFFIKKDFAKERLRHKRILVVLDDARNFRDLECLVGKLDWFGPGSRIILTSRNKQVLIRCQVDEIYEVRKLSKDDACLLFCQNAFRKDHPEKWFLKQAMDILNYVDGNPLALKVLSSNLYGKNLFAWENPSLMIRQNPTYNIFPVLKSSYHSLDDNEKNIFLDLTCFFRGEHEDDVTRFLDGCDFSAHVGLSILGDNSLIYILDNRVEMHNLYQDLGKEIVHGESIEPSKRSRLWDHEEIRHILTYAEGTETIEGISFDMARATFDLSPIAFKNMYRLRLLKIHGFSLKSTYGLNLPQGLEFLPDNLRLLHWENYPLKSLPRRFEPNNLVELNLSYSHIEKLWKGTKNLERLLKIKLSHSHQLIQMPRLSKASNLEHVDLEGCENLVKVGFSICHLDKLVFFNLKDCSKLQNLPTMVHLVSLEVLNLSGCSLLDKFPEVSPSIRELYLNGTSITKVPSSIQSLTKLVDLEMENCRRLENLPSSICKLKNLSKFSLFGCSSLKSFPEISETMNSLWFIDLRGTAIKELPSSITLLVALKELRLEHCKNVLKLPDNLWNLRAFSKVELHDTDTHMLSFSRKDSVLPLPRYHSSLHSLASRLFSLVQLSLRNADVLDIPEDICGLFSLGSLDLSGNGFQEIPANFSELSNLMNLSISSCRSLETILELPERLTYLDAHGCKSLEAVSWNAKQLLLGFRIPGPLHLHLNLIFTEYASDILKKQEIQGFCKASSFTMCFPSVTWPELLDIVLAGSSCSFYVPSGQIHKLLGFAFIVVVGFGKSFYDDSGFSIGCISNFETLKGESHDQEKIFFCWSQTKGGPRIRGDHTFVFYDRSMLMSLADESDDPIILAKFKFYPVVEQNKSLSGCKVKKCSVYMLFAEHEIEAVFADLFRP